jgi:hypothetical protein
MRELEERKAIYDEALLQVADDVQYLFFGHAISALAARPEIGGISG